MHFHTRQLGKFMLFTTRWCSKLVTKINTKAAGATCIVTCSSFPAGTVGSDLLSLMSVTEMCTSVVALRGEAVVAHQDGHLMVLPSCSDPRAAADPSSWGAQSSVRENRHLYHNSGETPIQTSAQKGKSGASSTSCSNNTLFSNLAPLLKKFSEVSSCHLQFVITHTVQTIYHEPFELRM